MELGEYLNTLSKKQLEGIYTFTTLSLKEEIVNQTVDALCYRVKGLKNSVDHPFTMVDIVVVPAHTKIHMDGLITQTDSERPLVLSLNTMFQLEYPDEEETATAYTLSLDKKRELLYQ